MEHIGKVYTENCLNDKKKWITIRKRIEYSPGSIDKHGTKAIKKDTPKLQYLKHLLLKLPH